MTPILYNFSPTFEDYISRGAGFGRTNICIGPLTKVTSANVRQVLNNEYDLKLSVLTSDPFAKYAVPGKVVLAKPNPTDNPQIFVIRNSNYNGEEIEIEAEHVKALFFNNVILANIDGTSATITGTPQEIVDEVLQSEVVLTNYFNFASDISNTYSAEIGLAQEQSLGDFFFNDEHGLNRTVNGEFKFNNFNINYVEHVGKLQPQNSIRYGTNLSSYTQELSDLKEYTHVLAYADVPVLEDETKYSGDVKSVRLYPPQTTSSLESILLPVTGSTSEYTRVFMLDVTSSFRKKGGYVVPSGPYAGEGYVAAQQQIKNKAQSYINGHANQMVGVSANIKITYEKALKDFDKPQIGDYVTVIYEPLDYKKVHRITEMEYDPVNEKVLSLTISEANRKFTLYDFIREVKYGHYV